MLGKGITSNTIPAYDGKPGLDGGMFTGAVPSSKEYDDTVKTSYKPLNLDASVNKFPSDYYSSQGYWNMSEVQLPSDWKTRTDLTY